jgi:hypothetical protein
MTPTHSVSVGPSQCCLRSATLLALALIAFTLTPLAIAQSAPHLQLVDLSFPDAPSATIAVAKSAPSPVSSPDPTTAPSNELSYCIASSASIPNGGSNSTPRLTYSSSVDSATDPGQAVSQTKPCVEGEQSKRILYIMPNYRAVSADTKLPALSPRQKFVLAAQDSFDYSAFIYVGLLAGSSMIQNSYPEFHQGAAGYARYYWHSFADNSIGNFFTEAIVPSITHEDPRYYTLGHGGFFKRTYYAASRLAITRTDSGDRTVNISEIVGNGAAAGISNLYYPSQTRTWTKTGQKWLIQIGLDGASNFLKEFWPDISHGLFHQNDCVPGSK